MTGRTVAVEAVVPRAFVSRAADFLELTKPRITGMVLVTTLVGFIVASAGDGAAHSHGPIAPLLLIQAIIGTALVTAGAQVLNQLLERRTDALMRRTEGRPLPAGRVQPVEALTFGASLAVAGAVVLGIAANVLAAALAVFALVSYLFFYTPLKRRTSLCTLVGALPGAVPPVIGWAAARGRIDAGALALFGILFVWQLPHFYAIAWMYRDDYARGGFPMLPVLDADGRRTGRHTIAWSLLLLPVSVLPAALGVSGIVYAAGAIVLGAVFVRAAALLARDRTTARARALLLTSVVYLPSLLGLMTLDSLMR